MATTALHQWCSSAYLSESRPAHYENQIYATDLSSVFTGSDIKSQKTGNLSLVNPAGYTTNHQLKVSINRESNFKPMCPVFFLIRQKTISYT